MFHTTQHTSDAQIQTSIRSKSWLNHPYDDSIRLLARMNLNATIRLRFDVKYVEVRFETGEEAQIAFSKLSRLCCFVRNMQCGINTSLVNSRICILWTPGIMM